MDNFEKKTRTIHFKKFTFLKTSSYPGRDLQLCFDRLRQSLVCLNRFEPQSICFDRLDSSCLCFYYEIENKHSTFSIKIWYVLTVLNLFFDFARPFFSTFLTYVSTFLTQICSIDFCGLQFSKEVFPSRFFFSNSNLSFVKSEKNL